MRTSVSTDWHPDKPMPPTREMYFDGTEQAMEEYRRHLLNSVLYYPETTTMTVRDLSYTDVLRWVHEYGFTGDGALSVARDLTAHLLGIPKDER